MEAANWERPQASPWKHAHPSAHRTTPVWHFISRQPTAIAFSYLPAMAISNGAVMDINNTTRAIELDGSISVIVLCDVNVVIGVL